VGIRRLSLFKKDSAHESALFEVRVGCLGCVQISEQLGSLVPLSRGTMATSLPVLLMLPIALALGVAKQNVVVACALTVANSVHSVATLPLFEYRLLFRSCLDLLPNVVAQDHGAQGLFEFAVVETCRRDW
jgi:hypothetical protein